MTMMIGARDQLAFVFVALALFLAVSFVLSWGSVELLGVVIGALVTSGLAEWAAGQRDKREGRHQSESAKTMLELEIDVNLEALDYYWMKVCPPSESESGAVDKEQELAELARDIVQIPLPATERAVLESQLSYLPRALDRPTILRIMEIYNGLRALEVIRQTLISGAPEQSAKAREANMASADLGVRAFAEDHPKRFALADSLLAQEFWTMAESLLESDNPLELPTPSEDQFQTDTESDGDN